MNPNDLEPFKVKCTLNICVAAIHESHILLRFILRPAVFELQVILRQAHRMTPNSPWTLQGHITLHMYNYSPRVSNFTLFCSTTSRFRDSGHSETSVMKDSKMTLMLSKVECTPYMCHWCPWVPGFTAHSTTSRFWDTGHCETKYTEWPHNDLNTTKSNAYMKNVCPQISNFISSRSTTSRFWDTGHF